MPKWTVYQSDNSVTDHTKERLGQAHRWFFLELKPDTNIDLSQGTDEEHSDFKWTTFEEAIAVTEEFRKGVYQELEVYFHKHVRLNS